MRAASNQDAPLTDAVNIVTTYAIADHFDNVLGEALRSRTGLVKALASTGDEVQTHLKIALDLDAASSRTGIIGEIANVVNQAESAPGSGCAGPGKENRSGPR